MLSLIYFRLFYTRPIKHLLREFLSRFKSEPSYEFIGVAILKINLVLDVKPARNLIKNSERVFITYNNFLLTESVVITGKYQTEVLIFSRNDLAVEVNKRFIMWLFKQHTSHTYIHIA